MQISSWLPVSRAGRIALGVCGVGVVVIAAVAWRNVRSVVPALNVNSGTSPVIASCEQAVNKEDCLAQKQAQSAEAAGDAKACVGLVGQPLENCVRLVVQQVGKDSACTMLEGDAKDRCRGDITLREALEKLDSDACGDIANERDRNACIEAVVSQKRTEQTCDAKDGADEECATLLVYREAVESGNRKLCTQITSEETQEACMQAVKERNDALEGTDADRDGLVWEDEREIGTDPNKADTDGDGYVDGEEVQGGFNPLGEGRKEIKLGE